MTDRTDSRLPYQRDADRPLMRLHRSRVIVVETDHHGGGPPPQSSSRYDSGSDGRTRNVFPDGASLVMGWTGSYKHPLPAESDFGNFPIRSSRRYKAHGPMPPSIVPVKMVIRVVTSILLWGSCCIPPLPAIMQHFFAEHTTTEKENKCLL